MDMETKAIFFDLGNVLLGFNWSITFPYILKKSPLTEKELGERLMQTRYIDYELDILSTQEFFELLKAEFQYEGETEELQAICTDIFYPIERNIKLAKRLCQTYRLGIISNTNEAHTQFVEEQYEFFNWFEVKVYSHEVRLRKPDRDIYHHAITAMGVQAEEALFIDDLRENVEAARDLGWRAIQMKRDTDLGAELIECGISIDP